MPWNEYVFVLAALFPAFVNGNAYACTENVECASTFGAPVVGTEADLASACNADVTCIQYQ